MMKLKGRYNVSETHNFPHISKLYADVNKLLASKVSKISLDVEDKKWNFCLNLESTKINKCILAVIFTIEGYNLKLNIQKDLLKQIIPEYLDVDTATQLPVDLLAAVLENSIQPLINAINHRFNTTIKFDGIFKADKSDESVINLSIINTEMQTTAYISLTEDLLHLVKKIPVDKDQAIANIPFFVRLDVGRVALKKAEINGLELEDIIFIDNFLGKNKVFINLSRHIIFSGELVESKLTIKNRIEKMDINSYSEQEETEDQSVSVSPADMEVNIIFEVGTQQVNASELNKISVGYIFNLETPVNHAIKVIANGKHIADSELVEIENKVGARITKIY